MLEPGGEVKIIHSQYPWMIGSWRILKVESDGEKAVLQSRRRQLELYAPGEKAPTWYAMGNSYGDIPTVDASRVQVLIPKGRMAMDTLDTILEDLQTMLPVEQEDLVLAALGQMLNKEPPPTEMTSTLPGDELHARFEEGKPADPTENMSPEDKKKWDKYHGQVQHLASFKLDLEDKNPKHKIWYIVDTSTKDMAGELHWKNKTQWTLEVYPDYNQGKKKTLSSFKEEDEEKGTRKALKDIASFFQKENNKKASSVWRVKRFVSVDSMYHRGLMVRVVISGPNAPLQDVLALNNEKAFTKFVIENFASAIEAEILFALSNRILTKNPDLESEPELENSFVLNRPMVVSYPPTIVGDLIYLDIQMGVKESSGMELDHLHLGSSNTTEDEILSTLEHMAEGCPDNLDEAACKEWEANTEQYRDKFKTGSGSKISWLPYTGGPIKLTLKEIARSEEDITIVIRPQAKGGYMVAAVNLSTGLPVGGIGIKVPFVETREGIPDAIHAELRFLSKMGLGKGLAESSRFRDIVKAARPPLLMPAAIRSKIPPIGATENTPDPIVWLKLFSPYSNGLWLITEFDGQDEMFGWAELQRGSGELGYMSLREFQNLKRGGLPLIERDMYFTPKPLSQAKSQERTA